MRNNEKNIKNGMIEWGDQSGGYRRRWKNGEKWGNQVINKSSNCEILFGEKRKNIKYKKGKWELRFGTSFVLKKFVDHVGFYAQ